MTHSKLPNDNEIEDFLLAVFAKIDDLCSPDVTLEVFRTISNRDFPSLKARYKSMRGGVGSPLNSRIGMAVKRLLGRENDIEVNVTENVFIQSYTRFYQLPCDTTNLQKSAK
jgi:hypothetical protein